MIATSVMLYLHLEAEVLATQPRDVLHLCSLFCKELFIEKQIGD